MKSHAKLKHPWPSRCHLMCHVPTVVFQPKRPSLQVDKMPTKHQQEWFQYAYPLGVNYLDFQKNLTETHQCDITAIGSLLWIGKILNLVFWKCFKASLVIRSLKPCCATTKSQSQHQSCWLTVKLKVHRHDTFPFHYHGHASWKSTRIQFPWSY